MVWQLYELLGPMAKMWGIDPDTLVHCAAAATFASAVWFLADLAWRDDVGRGSGKQRPTALGASFQMVVKMDIPPAKDALFNEVYNEHCEYLRGVPGVLAIRRYRTVPYDFTVGGVKRRVDPVANTNEPVYVAVFHLASPDVPCSPEWAAACEKGRWAAEIRPHTRNRSPPPGGSTMWEEISSVGTIAE